MLDRPRKPGSIGYPVWGVEMCILDENDRPVADGEPGEICIRGHNIMKGYWKRPDATQEALRSGWFHSGDIGVRDADGSYRIVDRKKDMIIRGGFNVYPREVEEVLYAHPSILEAAVIGVPHESHGEEVKAVIVRASRERPHARGRHRLVQGEARRLQVSAHRRVLGGPAQGADREDPEARAALTPARGGAWSTSSSIAPSSRPCSRS